VSSSSKVWAACRYGGVDAFLEPTEDRGEEGDRLLLPAGASGTRHPIVQMHRETYADTPWSRRQDGGLAEPCILIRSRPC
jgi:hypothetical protein